VLCASTTVDHDPNPRVPMPIVRLGLLQWFTESFESSPEIVTHEQSLKLVLDYEVHDATAFPGRSRGCPMARNTAIGDGPFTHLFSKSQGSPSECRMDIFDADRRNRTLRCVQTQ
jgi:hypothetical protein